MVILLAQSVSALVSAEIFLRPEAARIFAVPSARLLVIVVSSHIGMLLVSVLTFSGQDTCIHLCATFLQGGFQAAGGICIPLFPGKAEAFSTGAGNNFFLPAASFRLTGETYSFL
jgi:hypothetical protein